MAAVTGIPADVRRLADIRHARASFDSPASVCFAAAAIGLGHALQIAAGFYDPAALVWMTIALLLTGAGLYVVRADPTASGVPGAALEAIIAVGIAWQLVSYLGMPPAAYLRTTDLTRFNLGIGAEALCIAAAFSSIRGLDRLWFPTLLAAHAATGAWILRWSPAPHIDVFTVHRAAIAALLHGHNPYVITFQNIYGDTFFYNPSLVTGDRVNLGYPYPPLNLLLAALGQLLARDYRYAELTAIVTAGGFIGYSREGRIPKLAAALLVTTPRIFFVLEQGWTEPIALGLLAATTFNLARKPSWVPWTAGLLTVTKQYLVLAVPLLVRLGLKQRREAVHFFACAACAACVVTLPFAFWGLRPFVDYVVLLQFYEPMRIDSLSYVSWAVRNGWSSGSIWWPLVAAATAVLVGLLKTPNTALGLLASLTLATFVTFAFGSKAFCNYYFFVIGALCCTVALGAKDDPGEHPVREGPEPALN